MHGVPPIDGQQEWTTERNLWERMDIVSAENFDVTDDDEEVKEICLLSPLTFEADNDFARRSELDCTPGGFETHSSDERNPGPAP
jgi:hypothetical protein